MAIYSGFSHEKWVDLSIAMLVHQRVTGLEYAYCLVIIYSWDASNQVPLIWLKAKFLKEDRQVPCFGWDLMSRNGKTIRGSHVVSERQPPASAAILSHPNHPLAIRMDSSPSFTGPARGIRNENIYIQGEAPQLCKLVCKPWTSSLYPPWTQQLTMSRPNFIIMLPLKVVIWGTTIWNHFDTKIYTPIYEPPE